MMSLLALEVAFSIMLIGFAWASRIGWAHPLIRHCLQSVAEQKTSTWPTHGVPGGVQALIARRRLWRFGFSRQAGIQPLIARSAGLRLPSKATTCMYQGKFDTASRTLPLISRDSSRLWMPVIVLLIPRSKLQMHTFSSPDCLCPPHEVHGLHLDRLGDALRFHF